MTRAYSVEALVIKRTDFGEADRLITFLSRYRGKFTAIAKGIRKITSRRGPNLELFNHVKCYLAVGKNLDVITEAQTIATFKVLKESLSGLSFGFYLAELLDTFLEEGQGSREIFDLVVRCLRQIEKEKDVEKIKRNLRSFELELLKRAGYEPQFAVCAKCAQQLLPVRNFLSPHLGGVIHKECRQGTSLVKPVSADALKTLRFLAAEREDKVKRLVIKPSLNTEMEQLLKFYMEYLLEKELKSPKFIEKIKK